MLAAARSAPRTRPGKKPTRRAVMGNLLQDAVSWGDSFVTGVTDVEAPVVELDAEGVLADVDDVVGAMSWFASCTQFKFESQEYPNGQH